MKLSIRVLRGAVLLALSAIFSVLPAFGTTWTVTNTDDGGPGSLRDEIANAAAQGDTINFALAYPATITVLSSLNLNKSLTISGPGSDNLIISGGGSVGVFVISSGVEIDNLTVSEGSSLLGGCIYNSGNTTLNYVVVSQCGNQNTQLGGGIFNGGIMLIVHSTIDNNVAGFSGEVGKGGGIYNTTELGVSDGGSLQILFSDIRANRAVGAQPGQPCAFDASGRPLPCGLGGGIYNRSGDVSIQSTTVENNDASAGGAVNDGDEGGSTLSLSNCTVSGNSSNYLGAAIAAGGGDSVVITSSTIANSTFDLDNLEPDDLTTIYDNTGKELIITNSTIAGNAGNGISVAATPAKIAFTTIAHNSASGINGFFNVYVSPPVNATVLNSVLSDNQPNCSFNPQGLGSLGHNFSDDASCAGALNQSSDRNGVPVGLDPAGLGNNGGPTQTVALEPGSMAINAVPLSFCTNGAGQAVRTDQRGDPRPVSTGCDAGAFEFFISVRPLQASEIYNVVDQVQSLAIPPIPKGLLTLEGDTAALFVNIGNDNLATDELKFFIFSVNALTNGKVLTQQQSSDLTNPIQNVIKELAAGSSPQ
jgi:hypothetical protein